MCIRDSYILPFLLIFLSCSSLKVEVAVANRGLVENYANGKKNKILIEALEDRNLSFYQNYYTDFIKIYTDRNIEVGDGIKKLLRERISETYTDNLQPVSYTHLDVYKRQLFHCARQVPK